MKNKKHAIIFANGRPMYPFFIGGDGTSIHNLLCALSNRGFHCQCLGCYDLPMYEIPEKMLNKYIQQGSIKNYSKIDGKINYDVNYPCTLVSHHTFKNELMYLLKKDFYVDFVITQVNKSNDVIEICHTTNLMVILLVIDSTEPNVGTIRLLQKNDIIIFASNFLQSFFRKEIPDNVKSYVISPLIKVFNKKAIKKTTNEQKFITMINPIKHKGGKIVWQLAKKLPHRQFLIVELFFSPKSQGLDFSLFPNVTIYKRQLNMANIYEQSKIVIIPSQCDEGFGMVAIEAQAYGIPVLVSDRGALPEVIGEGGVVINPFDDVKKWILEIERVLAEQHTYDKLSQKSLANACRFNQDRVVDQYIKILGDI